VVGVRLVPDAPAACPDAVRAVEEADWLVFGPGSWFTSVLPHLMVPDLAKAIVATDARRCVALNLVAQPGETSGFSPETHLEVLAAHAPDLDVDVVLADEGAVPDPVALRDCAQSLGAELVLAPVAASDGQPVHDSVRLATAYAHIMGTNMDPENLRRDEGAR
jgi:uncharacterized cofD-like protein